METFEKARRYFAQVFQWHLHEDTFQMLDKDTWICRVTTTFNVKQGTGPEMSFYVLYRHGSHFTLEEEALPALLDWCLKMSAKGAA